ncbi:CitMHS family transporter [Phenylobacterium terrae]|uniref:CitMHS family transporter n=1 Tax=Phenylobacterium terrae TaxID=2665495 RepID=A0ABW4N645_9CAUL
MILALSGFGLVLTFMALIMTRRLSAITALMIVPVVFGLALGAGAGLGEHVMAGVRQVAPTAVMLVFALLYFGLMIDAGLFDPLVARIVRWVGDDPLRVTVGHAALAAIVGLDGDGTTTLLVCASAMLPIYRRLGMNVLIFGLIGGLCSAVMNLTPWGGPMARAASALRVDMAQVFLLLIPVIGGGLAVTFAIAVFFGLRERRRLRAPPLGAAPDADAVIQTALAGFERDPAASRPKLFLFNLGLTLTLMTAVVLHLAPLAVLFMGAFAVAMVVNYPRPDDQRARLTSHAGSVVTLSVMVFAAGAFAGVLSGTGMIDAMAGGIVDVLPPWLGPHMAVITAVLAMPMTFFLSNDAWYFGVVPVLAEAAKAYGITPTQIARASLMGQPVHGLSPMVAPLYLKCALLGVDLVDLQRFALRWTVLLSIAATLIGLATFAFPWAA